MAYRHIKNYMNKKCIWTGFESYSITETIPGKYLLVSSISSFRGWLLLFPLFGLQIFQSESCLAPLHLNLTMVFMQCDVTAAKQNQCGTLGLYPQFKW